VGVNEFDDPLIAGVYDIFDSDRSDVAVVMELGAFPVLDLGCGTGTLAITLASSGRDVVAVERRSGRRNARRRASEARGRPSPLDSW
jgi:predicted RNA methylase